MLRHCCADDHKVFCKKYTLTFRMRTRRHKLSSLFRAAFISHLLLSFVLIAHSQSFTNLTGFVYDQNGAGVSNATVRFSESSESGTQHSTSTDDTGHFLFENVSGRRGQLTVEAPGFRPSTIVLSGADVEMQIVLLPASVSESVTITRVASRIEETAASVVALDRNELEVTAAATLDDRLRQVPGFSLFRRAGSRSANPTAEGASLRGVGAAGGRRARVF